MKTSILKLSRPCPRWVIEMSVQTFSDLDCSMIWSHPLGFSMLTTLLPPPKIHTQRWGEELRQNNWGPCPKTLVRTETDNQTTFCWVQEAKGARGWESGEWALCCKACLRGVVRISLRSGATPGLRHQNWHSFPSLFPLILLLSSSGKHSKNREKYFVLMQVLENIADSMLENLPQPGCIHVLCST